MATQQVDLGNEGQRQEGQQEMQRQMQPQMQQQGPWQSMIQSYPTDTTMFAPAPGQQPGMMAPPPRECRNNAKLVAIVNMVINSIYMLFLFVIMILLAIPLPNLKDHLEENSGNRLPDIYVTIALVVIILAIIILLIVIGCIGLELWIDWGLYTSTRVETPPNQAIQKAKCWRCCHICLLVFNLFCGGFVFVWPSTYTSSYSTTTTTHNHGSYSQTSSSSTSFGASEGYTIGFGGFNIFLLCIRILFVYIVHSFIRQLQSAGALTGYQMM